MLKDVGLYVFATLLAVLFILYIRLFDNVLVTSPAMEPRLIPGDYVLVFSASYGVRIHILGTVIRTDDPERGDIVFFTHKEEDSDDRSLRSILRVVGLPGEKLEITDKVVYIDGNRLDEDYVSIEDDKTFPQDLSPRDNFGPVYVPEDQYLLLGDKRDVCSDGRFFGFVKREEIDGKVVLIYWSRDFYAGVFSNVRWDRIGLSPKNAD